MRNSSTPSSDTDRNFWLWVTKPYDYNDEDGNEREDLDPSNDTDNEGWWWTCHKDTKKGDLVFLWRTSPRCDIGYLIQAASDAYTIGHDDYASEHGWDYRCDYISLYKFNNPLTIAEIRNTAYLDDWNALNGRFQRRVFRTSTEHWEILNKLIITKNPKYKNFINKLLNTQVDRKIQLEEELEQELVQNLELLKPFGFNLKLYLDPITNASGQQYICMGLGGRIDLLCYDTKSKQYVVIELKNVRAGQNTFGQISSYVGWVKKNIAGKSKVSGLVISRGYDTKFESALSNDDKIIHLDLSRLGFS
jgi:hypothetical protein